MIRNVSMLAIALAVFAQPAFAQAGHQHNQQNGQGTMQQPMMDHDCMGMGMGMAMGRGQGPGMALMRGVLPVSAVLRAADALALTAQQKTQLEGIQTRVQQTVAPHRQQIMAAHKKLSELMQSNQPDLIAYESLLKEATQHRVAIQVAGLRAGLEARALLSAEQRGTLTRTASVMHSVMCEAPRGMMRHGR